MGFKPGGIERTWQGWLVGHGNRYALPSVRAESREAALRHWRKQFSDMLGGNTRVNWEIETEPMT